MKISPHHSQCLGSLSFSLSLSLSPQSIGFKGILLYGTEEQKAKYLPPVSVALSLSLSLLLHISIVSFVCFLFFISLPLEKKLLHTV